MKQKGKARVEGAVEKLARGIDYPIDTLLDIPSVHITGQNAILIEGCKGILFYTDNRITLDMGGFSISIHGTGIELQNLSKIELSIMGRISTVTYDAKEEPVDAVK